MISEARMKREAVETLTAMNVDKAEVLVDKALRWNFPKTTDELVAFAFNEVDSIDDAKKRRENNSSSTGSSSYSSAKTIKVKLKTDRYVINSTIFTIMPEDTLDSVRWKVCQKFDLVDKLESGKRLTLRSYLYEDEVLLLEDVKSYRTYMADVEDDDGTAFGGTLASMTGDQLDMEEGGGGDGDNFIHGCRQGLAPFLNRQFVGKKEKIETLKTYYRGEEVRTKVGEVEEFYSRWQPVLGDGSCYYRGVMVGLLDTILRDEDMGRRERSLDVVKQLFVGMEAPISNSKDNDEEEEEEESRKKEELEGEEEKDSGPHCFLDEGYKNTIEEALERAKEHGSIGSKAGVSIFKALKEERGLDDALIKGLRCLVATHIKAYSHLPLSNNFLSKSHSSLMEEQNDEKDDGGKEEKGSSQEEESLPLKIMIEALHDCSVDKFISDYILKNDAEGDAILNIAPALLGIKTRICMVDDHNLEMPMFITDWPRFDEGEKEEEQEDDENIKKMEEEEEEGDCNVFGREIVVHLLFRPGHYDILYERSPTDDDEEDVEEEEDSPKIMKEEEEDGKEELLGGKEESKDTPTSSKEDEEEEEEKEDSKYDNLHRDRETMYSAMLDRQNESTRTTTTTSSTKATYDPLSSSFQSPSSSNNFSSLTSSRIGSHSRSTIPTSFTSSSSRSSAASDLIEYFDKKVRAKVLKETEDAIGFMLEDNRIALYEDLIMLRKHSHDKVRDDDGNGLCLWRIGLSISSRHFRFSSHLDKYEYKSHPLISKLLGLGRRIYSLSSGFSTISHFSPTILSTFGEFMERVNGGILVLGGVLDENVKDIIVNKHLTVSSNFVGVSIPHNYPKNYQIMKMRNTGGSSSSSSSPRGENEGKNNDRKNDKITTGSPRMEEEEEDEEADGMGEMEEEEEEEIVDIDDESQIKIKGDEESTIEPPSLKSTSSNKSDSNNDNHHKSTKDEEEEDYVLEEVEEEQDEKKKKVVVDQPSSTSTTNSSHLSPPSSSSSDSKVVENEFKYDQRMMEEEEEEIEEGWERGEDIPCVDLKDIDLEYSRAVSSCQNPEEYGLMVSCNSDPPALLISSAISFHTPYLYPRMEVNSTYKIRFKVVSIIEGPSHSSIFLPPNITCYVKGRLKGQKNVLASTEVDLIITEMETDPFIAREEEMEIFWRVGLVSTHVAVVLGDVKLIKKS